MKRNGKAAETEAPASIDSKTAAVRLLKCAGILEQLANIVKQQRVIEWWPAEEYSFFRGVSEQLDRLLTEQMAG